MILILQRGAADEMPVVFLPETSDVECVADNRYRVSFCDTQLSIQRSTSTFCLMKPPPCLPAIGN